MPEPAWPGTPQQVLSCPAPLQGRNASEQVKMLQRIEQHNARQPPGQRVRVSVEVEKPREELFQLFGYGDVVSVPGRFLPHPANLVLERSLRRPLSGPPCLDQLAPHGPLVLAGGGQSRGPPPALGSGAGLGCSQGKFLYPRGCVGRRGATWAWTGRRQTA